MEWADGKQRCWWANPNNEAYVRYHDEEWGVPVRDDRMLFEMLILEGFQAGLSWECVLNKRAAFRRAFDNFDAQAVSAYDSEKLAVLQSDAGIIPQPAEDTRRCGQRTGLSCHPAGVRQLCKLPVGLDRRAGGA